MAVVFHPDSFEIKVKTIIDPIESWLEIQREMLDVLQSEDEEVIKKRVHIIRLLQNMLPDLDTARKMR